MLDLQQLRPRAATPAAIADALSRTEVAARGISAEIGRLRTQRDNLLVVGTNEALVEAEAELKQAVATGETVMAMHAELQRRLTVATPPTPAAAEEAARMQAIKIAAEFASWRQSNGASMTRGLTLLGAASQAMATWCQAQAGAAAPSQPTSNVIPIGPGAA